MFCEIGVRFIDVLLGKLGILGGRDIIGSVYWGNVL
jgi:hypothetical protein